MTIDELPRYGINRTQKRTILEKTGATENDCTVIFAYDFDTAMKVNKCLEKTLKKYLE